VGWPREMTASGLLCGSCGTELSENAKFCSECGAAVTSAAKPAEYKQVTVLFADVVHSMDIAAAVGAERLREIMAELVERATAVVQRYGGTVDKFTGDGVMAVFGAPIALEDHAVRACLAALSVQEEAKRLAVDVRERDGVDLQLRVGLNSGQVIAGDIGPRSLGYTTIGEQVGMAQRMESVAPPGGVMLGESTAGLVRHTALLSEAQRVHIKGAADPVTAFRLLQIDSHHDLVSAGAMSLIGRRWEVAALEAVLERAIDGQGGVVSIVGPAGIGKSRLVRELTAMATNRGVEIFGTFCESHTREIPFHAITGLLRSVGGVTSVDNEAARARVRVRVPDADPEDLLLLDDMLGIADPDAPLPRIDPDARRRRLAALFNSAQLARIDPALFIVEDVHWIDEVSESMVQDLFSVVPRTPSLVVSTYRPEYQGPLAHISGAQVIALTPLSDSESAALIAELLGSDPSVGELAKSIGDRAAGNPFFTEEIVRDLTERGVLRGNRGALVRGVDAVDISVPATLQAVIAARIDRLDAESKQTLNAAAVIGSRFTPQLVTALGIDPVVDELVRVELIDQVRFTPLAEYAFRHPLIRTVAYESQLKSDRAQLHRRLAAAIEQRDPDSADENAALIAEHLEAAGDVHAAYDWHIRAAGWSTNRDIAAARLSWERARKIADALPADDPDRAAMRIAPRTMLCGIAWRVHENVAGARFEELRELCTAAGDKASLAIGMAGLVMDHAFQSRMGEASRLASEAMALAESVGDPTLTVGLSFAPIYAKYESAEFCDVLRWSQAVIDLADGDPFKGNFIFGTPLALAFTTRGMARYFLGRPGWRDDLRHGLAMARSADPLSYAVAITYVSFLAIPCGVLRADDTAVREIEDAVPIAERSGDDLALNLARGTLGVALVHRHAATERDRGQQLLAEAGEVFPRRGLNLGELPIINVYLARERARRGDRDDAIPLMRVAVDDLFRVGRLPLWGVAATGVLVETLLDRGADGDVVETAAAIERLAGAPADEGLVMRDIWLLRLRVLLARAQGHNTAYRDFRDRYRNMAKTLGFEGHIDWAEAMP
jgi:class 3 adenylate cyclase